MRLKLLRSIGKKDTLPKSADNPASLELPFRDDGTMYVEGEVDDFSKADAEKLIKANLAVETTEAATRAAKGGPPSSGDAPKGGK
jgi:hypothetical protein